MGLGIGAMVRVGEVLGAACASTSICFGMHCVASAVIAAKATPAHEDLLATIAAGEHLTTLALSEPGSGSHFYFPETEIHTDADTLRIRGEKSFVTNGGQADSYVISAVSSGEDAPPGEFSCVVIPSQAEGITWSGDWNGLGMRGNSSRFVKLDVSLPHDALLGNRGDQIWYVFNVVAPYFLSAMSGTYLGITQAAIQETIAHMKKRHHNHNGMALSENPILQHRLGELWAAQESARCLTRYAADATDAGEDVLPALLSSKAEVADSATRAVNECMTLCGGKAYAENGLFGRWLRDLRAIHVMAPTTDILRTWVGRLLLDERLFSD
tara:strand:- start:54 stop:1031 length:978 start_codon:yes stop_codon:yes gene_type:complete